MRLPGDPVLWKEPAPGSPLQTAKDLLAKLGGQVAEAELLLGGSPLEAVEALKHMERNVQAARQAVKAVIIAQTPKGASRVILYGGRVKSQ